MFAENKQHIIILYVWVCMTFLWNLQALSGRVRVTLDGESEREHLVPQIELARSVVFALTSCQKPLSF